MWRTDYKKAAFVIFLLLLTDGIILLMLFMYRADCTALQNIAEKGTDVTETISEPIARLTDIAEVKKQEPEIQESVSLLLSSIQKDIKEKDKEILFRARDDMEQEEAEREKKEITVQFDFDPMTSY